MTKILKFDAPEIRVQLPGTMTDEELQAIFDDHRDLQIEQEPDGTLVFMSPVTNLSGDAEAEVIIQLGIYAREAGGRVYSPSTGFRLPDGSLRSPDASYLKPNKVARFTEVDLRSFIAEVPDFVVEIRSKSDSLKNLRSKMQNTWMANGVPLGWLIELKNQKVTVYEQGQEPVVHEGFERTLDGGAVLPDFSFDLRLLLR